ncbi:hypothetical protein [Iodobacter sp.]|uniref:hypothetical protein n=1 Tax=Iodobacter sp. TaxID=1915058 RepID=UPI0025D25F95|nr:hypothetical protein [Iodobacter sp.]
MTSPYSAQPSPSEHPTVGAAALAAFLSAPVCVEAPTTLKPAFLLPSHSREARQAWRQVVGNVADFLGCSQDDKADMLNQLETPSFLAAVLAIAKGYCLASKQSLAILKAGDTYT